MPMETRFYVPKLQAVKNIVSNPQAYSLTLPALANHPYFLGVAIKRDIDVELAARLAGMSLEDFKTLNPQMNKPVILAAGTPQVLLPYDNASSFVRKLSEHRAPLATWTAWVAPRTMRPEDAARLVGMSESQLREINRIPPRMLVKAGSTLLVPRSEQRHADVATIGGQQKIIPVARWNSVGTGTRFKPGATIVVYEARRNAASLRAATGGKAKKPVSVTAAAKKKSSRVAQKKTSTRKAVRLAAD